jgi:hypothetical protein
VSVPFTAVSAVQMIDSLAENFKKRFNDFRSHAADIRIFETPYSSEVSDASERLRLKSIEI